MKSFTLALLSLAFAAACGSKSAAPAPQTAANAPASSGPACKNIEAKCDKSIADADVMKTVKTVCWRCHANKGIAGHDFPDIEAVKHAPVAYMVGSCQMPPDGNPLAQKDREMLTNWSACQQAEGEKAAE
ncbi:MAG TPA: hypothetical protein VFP84_20140 [Kofleriaceae bacterium]|nr:hypothetical protein [Kofleriaceae bacterium]